MTSSSLKIVQSLPWVFLLIIVCINAPSCQGVQFLCGGKINEVLDMICINGFGTKTKKSLDPLDFYANIEDDGISPFEDSDIPYFSKVSQNSLTKTRRRRHLGVYDECCRKPCTMDELRSYCL